MTVVGPIRFVAGAVVASLVGAAIVGVLFISTPISDWVGFLSNPINMCGYIRSPDEYPCLSRLFAWLSLRMIAVSIVTWGPAFFALWKVRKASLAALLVVGAVAGAVGGFIMKVLWVVSFVGHSFWENVFPPDNPLAPLNGALISGGIGVVAVGVFRLIVGSPPAARQRETP